MTLHEVEILGTGVYYSLREVCDRSGLSAETLIEWVEYGIAEPQGPAYRGWQFPPQQLSRICRASRLQRDLRINVAGLALALELLEELESTQQELASLKQQLNFKTEAGES